MSATHGFTVEVQHVEDFVLSGCTVDTDVSNAAQQCEVDLSRCVFFVVGHELVQRFVCLAVEREHAVIPLDEVRGLA